MISKYSTYFGSIRGLSNGSAELSVTVPKLVGLYSINNNHNNKILSKIELDHNTRKKNQKTYRNKTVNIVPISPIGFWGCRTLCSLQKKGPETYSTSGAPGPEVESSIFSVNFSGGNSFGSSVRMNAPASPI